MRWTMLLAGLAVGLPCAFAPAGAQEPRPKFLGEAGRGAAESSRPLGPPTSFGDLSTKAEGRARIRTVRPKPAPPQGESLKN